MREILFSRKNQLLSYILIIFIAPFVMCRYYLQPLIAQASQFSFQLFGINIALVPIILFLFIILILFFTAKYLTRIRLVAIAGIVVIIFISQYLSDFYMGNTFYDIQNNWHYLAYGVYSYLANRYFSQKKISISKRFFFIFAGAVFISTTDEFLQNFMTNRVFDLSDIAKDMMGAVIGLIFIFFVLKNGDILRKRNIPKNDFWRFIKNPLNELILLFLFTLSFLFFSSLLTEKNVRLLAIVFSFGFFLFIFFMIYCLRFKIVRLFLIALVIAQITIFFLNFRKNIVHHSRYLTVYKGIAIPYFDVMIFENGTFRLVDKKKFFNSKDISVMMHHADDILLIGSGETGKGGNGFSSGEKMHFIFNEEKNMVTQILNLHNKDAVKMFNNLQKQNKNVMMVLHHD